MAVTRARITLPGLGRRSAAEPATTAPGQTSTGEIDDLVPPGSTKSGRPRSTRREPEAEVGLIPEAPFETHQPRPLRILLVEDVDDVAAHLRDVLRASPSTHLIGIVRDSRKAVDEVRELRPDIVIVDSLLAGRSGVDLGRHFRDAGLAVGVIALTVPDRPIKDPARHGIDVVLHLPISTFDLGRAIGGAMSALRGRDPARSHRIVAVFGPKGGVGRTTIAYNLAVALAETGLRTALVDGSLQYGDIRRLVRASPTEPSLCDLPTDSVRGSDLSDTLLQDPSGVEILLAPPRPEMADLVTTHDLEAIVELLRRTYQAVVIDTPTALGESTLVMLDAADIILNVVTPEASAIDATRTALDAFAAMGYPDAKVQVVVNRSDTRGAMTRAQISRALDRIPGVELPSDWELVSGANARGVSFVREQPEAPLSAALREVAASVARVVGTQQASTSTRTRRRRAG
jgi:pilus assembly protein CpaE